MRNARRFFLMLILACLLLTGCMTGGGTDEPDTNWVSLSDAPTLPESLTTNGSDVPTLKVYDVSKEKIVERDLEEYVDPEKAYAYTH